MSLADFEIGKTLGKGAFGVVCVVKRREDNKTYAMKRVKISQLSMKDRENALNEIRILASLSHPNIIGYKEAFFDDNSKTLNIVMEYADDGDIASKIKENQQKRQIFKESTIWFWLIQILQGLKYLHDNKIMHRDLKSANIFLMKNGFLKLGDLNVSKIAKMGMASTQTGTPYYASPEIWKDRPYNYKSDIWSVGCIIYEICTLRPPFRGTSLKDLYENINRGVYSPIPYNYSKELSKVISMMLVVEPNRRPSTDELLNCDIIKEKIKSSHSNVVQDIIENSNKNEHANLIKTIKMPRNMRDINQQLPKKRYKQREAEMMQNDGYEIMKATLKGGGFNAKDIKKQIDAIVKGNDVPAVEQKPPQRPQTVDPPNNYHIPGKPPQHPITPAPSNYVYINNHDKDIKKREPPQSSDKNALLNNYDNGIKKKDFPQPSNKYAYLNNYDNQMRKIAGPPVPNNNPKPNVNNNMNNYNLYRPEKKNYDYIQMNNYKVPDPSKPSYMKNYIKPPSQEKRPDYVRNYIKPSYEYQRLDYKPYGRQKVEYSRAYNRPAYDNKMNYMRDYKQPDKYDYQRQREKQSNPFNYNMLNDKYGHAGVDRQKEKHDNYIQNMQKAKNMIENPYNHGMNNQPYYQNVKPGVVKKPQAPEMKNNINKKDRYRFLLSEDSQKPERDIVKPSNQVRMVDKNVKKPGEIRPKSSKVPQSNYMNGQMKPGQYQYNNPYQYIRPAGVPSNNRPRK